MSLVGATRAERLRDALSAFHLGWRQGTEYAHRFPDSRPGAVRTAWGCTCSSCTAQMIGWEGGFEAAHADDEELPS